MPLDWGATQPNSKKEKRFLGGCRRGGKESQIYGQMPKILPAWAVRERAQGCAKQRAKKSSKVDVAGRRPSALATFTDISADQGSCQVQSHTPPIKPVAHTHIDGGAQKRTKNPAADTVALNNSVIDDSRVVPKGSTSARSRIQGESQAGSTHQTTGPRAARTPEDSPVEDGQAQRSDLLALESRQIDWPRRRPPHFITRLLS